MRWEDERYVRVYTRDTLTWKRLGWEGQAALLLLMRKVDRAGILEIGNATPAEAVEAMTGMPIDLAAEVWKRLESTKTIILRKSPAGDVLCLPNFIEAQEAVKSPNARQQESRINRRDLIRAGLDPDQRGTVIYFIQSEHGGPIKIGRAEDLARRLVGLQTSRPDKLVVLAAAQGTIEDEKRLHRRFAQTREKGEWFAETKELMSLVKDVNKRGSEAIAVTESDTSQNEEGHKTSPVTPSLPSLPSLAVPEETKATAAGATASLPLVEKPSEPKPKKPEATPEQEDCRRIIRARFEAEWTRRAIPGAEFRWGPAEHNGITALAALDGEGKGTNPAKGLRALETFIERMAVKNYYRDNFAPRIVAMEINNLRQAVQADRPAARGAASIHISEEAKTDHAVPGRKLL